jgi:hypothetical protein
MMMTANIIISNRRSHQMTTTKTKTKTTTTLISRIRRALRELTGGQAAIFRYDREFGA